MGTRCSKNKWHGGVYTFFHSGHFFKIHVCFVSVFQWNCFMWRNKQHICIKFCFKLWEDGRISQNVQTSIWRWCFGSTANLQLILTDVKNGWNSVDDEPSRWLCQNGWKLSVTILEDYCRQKIWHLLHFETVIWGHSSIFWWTNSAWGGLFLEVVL